MMSKKIDIFDFDGTLISVNSFHLFLFFLILREIVFLRLVSVCFLLRTVVQRACKNVSHIEFKWKVNQVGLRLGQSEVRFFLRILSLFNRRCIIEALNRSKASADTITVIASAAPFAYMKYISLELPVDLVISFGDEANITPSLCDNVGNSKLLNLSHRLGVGVSNINLLYTDHADDLPIALIANDVFLVEPDIQFIETLAAKSVRYTIV